VIRREVISRILCHCVLHNQRSNASSACRSMSICGRARRPQTLENDGMVALSPDGFQSRGSGYLYSQRWNGLRQVPEDTQGETGLFTYPLTSLERNSMTEEASPAARANAACSSSTSAAPKNSRMCGLSVQPVLRSRHHPNPERCAPQDGRLVHLDDPQRKSRDLYRQIGGGSPLRRITEEQAAALARSSRRRGILPGFTWRCGAGPRRSMKPWSRHAGTA